MREKGIGSEKGGKSIGDTVSGTGGDFIKKFFALTGKQGRREGHEGEKKALPAN